MSAISSFAPAPNWYDANPGRLAQTSDGVGGAKPALADRNKPRKEQEENGGDGASQAGDETADAASNPGRGILDVMA